MSWWSRLFSKSPAPTVEVELRKRGIAIADDTASGVANAPLTPPGGRPRFVAASDIFRIPAPPPTIPAEAKMAMDEAWGDTYAWAAGAGGFAWNEGLGFLGYPYLSELTQRPEYRRISEIIAKEMTRQWIELKANGDEDKQDTIDTLNAALSRYRVQAKFQQVAQHDGFFGRGQIYLDTGAGEDPELLKSPLILSPATIKKGALKGLTVIEPIWTYPNAYNTSNPLAPDYFRPSTWFVQSKLVHHTRLLIFVGREMPDLLKPAYAFGGLSLSQMAKPYVDNWLRTRQSVSDLIHSFSIVVLKTNLSDFLNGGAAQMILKRILFFNATRDNRGSQVIDKDTEEVENIAVPLGTLDKLQAQAQEQMASVSGIPLVKLLGITPSGLNASSDGEIRVFYDWIKAQQQHLFGENLKRILDVIQLSELGKIDPDISFEFVPLWQLDEAARALVNKTKADTAAVYIQEGVIDNEEERQRVANDPDSDYDGLDLSKPAPTPPAMAAIEEGVTGDPARSAEPRSEERSGV